MCLWQMLCDRDLFVGLSSWAIEALVRSRNWKVELDTAWPAAVQELLLGMMCQSATSRFNITEVTRRVEAIVTQLTAVPVSASNLLSNNNNNNNRVNTNRASRDSNIGDVYGSDSDLNYHTDSNNNNNSASGFGGKMRCSGSTLQLHNEKQQKTARIKNEKETEAEEQAAMQEARRQQVFEQISKIFADSSNSTEKAEENPPKKQTRVKRSASVRGVLKHVLKKCKRMLLKIKR